MQSPDCTQSYNRYSYVWNNPLKYTDPSGEFIVVDSWIFGFISGFFSSGSKRFRNAWREANSRAENDLRIWGGLFVSDANKNFGGRLWEVFSRFTWQLPQTIGGLYTSHAHNTFGLQGGVESVDYAFGATVVRTRDDDWGAVALGSFITGDGDIRAEANNPLFQHEFGHYLQSQRFGLFYIPKFGIPSILSKGDFFDHGNHSVEQDANIRALTYFMANAEGFTLEDWNFNRTQGGHPIVGFNPTLSFDNENNLAALSDGSLRLEWFDYFLGPNVPNFILHGLLNALILNSRF